LFGIQARGLDFKMNAGAGKVLFSCASSACREKSASWEAIGLSMRRLQIRLFGPYFSSFSVHSYGYEPSNELKSVLKHPYFRFGPDSPTASWLKSFARKLLYMVFWAC
jgi:hypothetical protein